SFWSFVVSVIDPSPFLHNVGGPRLGPHPYLRPLPLPLPLLPPSPSPSPPLLPLLLVPPPVVPLLGPPPDLGLLLPGLHPPPAVLPPDPGDRLPPPDPVRDQQGRQGRPCAAVGPHAAHGHVPRKHLVQPSPELERDRYRGRHVRPVQGHHVRIRAH